MVKFEESQSNVLPVPHPATAPVFQVVKILSACSISARGPRLETDECLEIWTDGGRVRYFFGHHMEHAWDSVRQARSSRNTL